MPGDTRIDTLLGDATSRLDAVSDSARLDAELLLARAIDVPRSYLFAHPEDVLDDAAADRFEHLLQRRLDGEPLAYIDGTREFWSMELMVTPATLVPRPETEILVGLAVSALSRRAPARVLDLGTGSGAIALAIARERPSASVTAIDRSEDALAVARENARQLDIANVEFLAGDWTAPVRDREFDLVVSNPPYVRDDDPALLALRHEPRAALAAGPDGLDAIRRLARECREVLVVDGLLLLEHGAAQAGPVADILVAEGWSDVRGSNDYAGLPRVTGARNSSRGAQCGT